MCQHLVLGEFINKIAVSHQRKNENYWKQLDLQVNKKTLVKPNTAKLIVIYFSPILDRYELDKLYKQNDLRPGRKKMDAGNEFEKKRS